MLRIYDYVSSQGIDIEGVWIFTKGDKVKIAPYLGEVPHEINLMLYPLEVEVTNLARVIVRKRKYFLLTSPIESKKDGYSRSSCSIGTYFPYKVKYPDKGIGIVRSVLLDTVLNKWEPQLVLFEDSDKGPIEIVEYYKDKR